ncbi:hypothetical protein EXU85_03625 [Spirosoma sp. KCTC 42546]|uniref:virulence factor SrfC family protein n=1 Tax=Spirosoma sp. KCTC 42546 TaxID=2520506 RepID=UPI001158DD71|nr:virulence factor SrfC family protein [Spirosoma sp. KCTC 42546]QDK77732.1 hypothetical protein EXU85_03625 [Spirosoma sp. KCTC 42546]
MTNLPENKLKELAESVEKLVGVINDGIKCSTTFHHLDTSFKLKKNRRLLNKVRLAIVQKPTIALFGASQAGKSYLVKNILSDKNNQLFIADPRSEENTINFIKEANPEGGGSEATSLVTRFTFNEHSGKSLPPVKIRLLQARDIITIILDSYFSDFKKRKNTPDINKIQIELFLSNLSELYDVHIQHYLTEDDVYDIEDYITNAFGSAYKNKLASLKDADYWRIIGENIHKISPNNWTKLFSIIWGQTKELDRLFNLLIGELQKLKFSTELYAEFDSVLRDKGAILNVVRLQQLFWGSGQSLRLVDESGNNFSADASVLCALGAEVIFNISENSIEKNPFIKNVDILDFPGARSRLEQDENDPLTEDHLTNMLLRGKVAYLFNSYSLRYELNNLFICTNNRQSNVNGLSELIDSWINYNVGNTPQERTQTLKNVKTPPLFIVFTFWNTQLEYDQDNDEKDLEHKWELRFNKLFRGEIKGTFNWPTEWTQNGPFNNYFLLRDLKYSKDLYSGFEALGYEKELHSFRKGHYDNLKTSFERSILVREFFPKPETVWEQTSTLNNDGSKYIIQHIDDIANNQIRTNRFIQLIEGSQAEIRSLLSERYHDEAADNKIVEAAAKASEIHAVMNSIFGEDAYRFGQFIEKFTVQEKEIFELYHEELRKLAIIKAPDLKRYQFYRESSPRLNSNKTYEENLVILMQDYFRSSPEATETYFTEELKIDLKELFYGNLFNIKNKSEVLAEQARQYWIEKRLNVEHFGDIIQQGLNKTLLERLLENMKVSFDKCGITLLIAKEIRMFVDTVNRVDTAEDMIADATVAIINEFVTSFGWTFYSPQEKQKIKEANDIAKLNLSLPSDEELFLSLDRLDEEIEGRMSLERLLEYMVHLNEHLNKVPLDMEVVKTVPMIKNYRLWREKMKACFIANCDIPTYNIEENRQLGILLDRIKLFNFSLS